VVTVLCYTHSPSVDLSFCLCFSECFSLCCFEFELVLFFFLNWAFLKLIVQSRQSDLPSTYKQSWLESKIGQSINTFCLASSGLANAHTSLQSWQGIGGPYFFSEWVHLQAGKPLNEVYINTRSPWTFFPIECWLEVTDGAKRRLKER